MYSDINLLTKNEQSTAQKEKVKKLKDFSYILLFSIAFLSVGIFLINLRFSVNSIKKQQNQVTQSISVYNETSAKIILLNSRLDDISYILDQRKSYATINKIVDSSQASGASINVFTVTQNSLTIALFSDSLANLDTILNNILKLSSSSEVKSVNLKVLKADNPGFTMELEVGL